MPQNRNIWSTVQVMEGKTMTVAGILCRFHRIFKKGEALILEEREYVLHSSSSHSMIKRAQAKKS
ncbi:MAG: hypothetical protein ACLUD0_17100 [Eubacterium ramulus]